MESTKKGETNMGRIDVSAEWRMSKCDSTLTLEFANDVDKHIVMQAIKSVTKTTEDASSRYDLWIQDLEDCTLTNGFDIVSSIPYYEIDDYIPKMCKAIAEALPDTPFEGNFHYSDQQCFYVHDYEFSYDGKDLHLKSWVANNECGHFCPECEDLLIYADSIYEKDTITCETCEKEYKVTDLKFVPPVEEESIIPIKKP